MPSDTFSIEMTVQKGVSVYSIKGYGTARTAESLGSLVEKQMAEKPGDQIWDFSGCPIINSPGVVAFTLLGVRIEEDYRRRLIVTGLSEIQHQVFELAGMFAYIDEEPTLEAALATLAAP